MKRLWSMVVSVAILAGAMVAPVALSRPVSAAPKLPPSNPIPGAAVSSNTIAIHSVKVFSDYIATGDWLICAEIDNTRLPYYTTDTVGRDFVVNLKTTDNATILAATPLLFWEDAPVAIYVSPTMAAGLTYGAAYQFQVIGTYTSPASANYTLTSSDWQGSDKTNLSDWVLNTAGRMDTYYGASIGGDNSTRELVHGGAVLGVILSQRGTAYFTKAIPNLATIMPDLVLTPSNSPAYTQTAPVNAADSSGTIASELGTGTLAQDLTVVANLFGGTQAAGGMVFLLIVVIGLILAGSVSQGTGVGILVFGVGIVYVAALVHVISMVVPLLIAALALFVFVRKFWWSST